MPTAARQVTISFLGSTAELEASLRRAGLVAEQSGAKIGDSFTSGTRKAGGAMSKLGQEAAGFGIPFAASLQTVGKHLDATTAKTQRLHGVLSEAGKVTLLAGGAGLAAVAGEAVKLGQSYETAQAKIQGATGQSAKSAGDLTHAFGGMAGSSDMAVASGQQMEQAYSEVAGQLKLTEGHALSTAETMKFSAAANDLAGASGVGVAAAYGATASVMQAFHLSASQAASTTDTLYNVSQAVHVPVETLATSMAKLHSRLGELAPSLGDVAGLITALGARGVQGSRGIQVVNTAFQTLVSGGKNTTAVLKDLGVHVYDQQGHFIGLQNVIAQLQPRLAGLTQQQRLFAESALFGKGASQIMGQVVMAGVPAFQHATDAATKLGTAHKAAELHAHTFHGEMTRLSNTAKTLGGELGLILIPDIQKVATALADGVKWLEKHKAAAEALGLVITGVLGTAVSVFAYDKAVAFVSGTKRMIDGMTSLVTHIAGGTAEIEGSFAAQGAAAEAAAAKVGGTVAGEAGAVTAADTTIETENAAAGASFTAMLGPIAAVVAAVAAAEPTINKLTGGGLTEGPQHSNEITSTLKNSEARLANTSRHSMVESAAKRYGIPASTLWGVYGNETAYGTNIATSSAGAQGAFQFIPSTAKEYGYPLTNTPSPQQFKQQADAAAKYLSVLVKQHHGNVSEALEAYSGQTPGYAQKALQNASTFHPEAASAVQQTMEEQSGARPKTKAGAKARKAPSEPYAAPLAHPQITREDMGLDFAAHPGEAVKAIGSGVIDAIVKNWYKGQELIEEKLTSGSHKDQYVYYAEQLRSKVGVGQHVAAGQQIATVAGSGTGLEFGFGAGGGRTLAQATTGFVDKEGNDPTQASKAYEKFLASIGKGGSVISAVTQAREAATKAEEKHLTTLETAAKKLLGEGTGRGNLESAIQSGSVPQLEKILGVSTAGRTGAQVSGLLAHGQGQLSQSALEHALMPTLAKGAQGTPAGKAYDAVVKELNAAGLKTLAADVTQAHKQALADLGRELYAVTQERQAQALTNEATEAKDRNTQAANLASKQLQVVKDQTTQQTDAMTAAAKQIDDTTQQIKDSFSAMAEAVTLATQKMSDAASGEVQKTQDTTATRVAELGERGKYGLELIAQKEEVQLDQMKAGYDVQIQQAKLALDQAKISGQQLIAEKQQNYDLLQSHEDALVATAQAHADAVTVSQDTALAAAQAQLDTVQLGADIRTDLAQQAQVLVAGGTKAQQDVAKGWAAWASAQGGKELAGAQGHLSQMEAAANSAIQSAQGALSQVQAQAQVEISNAQQALARAEGQSKQQQAQAEQALVSIEDTAKVAEAGLEGQVAITRAEASTQYQGSGLTVHIENIEGGTPLDAQAIAAEMGWELRHRLPIS